MHEGAGITAEKVRLRAALGAARRARPAGDLEAARTAVRAAVLDAQRAAGWDCMAAYEPLRTEPGSTELLHRLDAAGVRVLVPITLADRDLDWAQWSPTGLGPALGRDAVSAASAVLVPALAVASDGTRLGRGGGSYDRALPRCAPGAVRAALVFDDEVLDALPHDDWDRPVSAAVRPSGWLALSP